MGNQQNLRVAYCNPAASNSNSEKPNASPAAVCPVPHAKSKPAPAPTEAKVSQLLIQCAVGLISFAGCGICLSGCAHSSKSACALCGQASAFTWRQQLTWFWKCRAAPF